MPKFYFHLREGGQLTRDEEGRELKDSRTARSVAVMGARDIMCGQLILGHINLSDAIEVEDKDRRKVFEVEFRDAVRFDD